MSLPAKQTLPELAETKPLIVFNDVDFPLPLAPNTATTSCFEML